ncbi:MAG: hypothetical protein Kow00105_02760 [Phycisphaeraceae bacterium]
MTTQLVTLDPELSLYDALEEFDRVEHEVLPVVDRHQVWHGMLSRSQVASTLRSAMEQVSRDVAREHAGLKALQTDVRVEQLLLTVPSRHVRIQRLFVPIDAIGKTLKESRFRNRYHADVIAIEEPDGSLLCPPPIDTPLKTEHRLLVVVQEPETPENT